MTIGQPQDYTSPIGATEWRFDPDGKLLPAIFGKGTNDYQVETCWTLLSGSNTWTPVAA